MQRLHGALRQAWRNGWGATAGLALLTLLVFLLIDNRWNQALALRSPPWALLPVFVGVMVLNAKQESVLAAQFFVQELIYKISHRPNFADVVEEQLFLRRMVILLACIWTAHVNRRLQEKRKNLQRNEERLMHKLSQSLKASALAHELRQPLSQLLLQTRLMQHRFEQDGSTSPALQIAMADVQTSGRQINQLIAAIHDLFHEATPPQRLDLAMVVRTCLKRLGPQLQATGVELELNGLEQPWLVNGQGTQLEMACCNLLSNGLEALKQQPSPRRLAVALSSDGDRVELQVADSGPGLRSTQLSDLVMASTKAKGMGVGLLTVQSIASRHDGSLQLGQSARLGGAELRLRLPLAAPHPN
jgi:signal transduction histidine kinase